jgi:hypothetical protein
MCAPALRRLLPRIGVKSESSRACAPGSHNVSRMTPQLIIDSNGGAAFEDGPDRGRVLIAGESTDNAYSLMELTVAARIGEVGFGPHLHRDIEELFVVRKGTLGVPARFRRNPSHGRRRGACAARGKARLPEHLGRSR